MANKTGFTLVEILFVLVIAAGILAYAVPSYKRAKERSKYEAATGILMDLGSAMRALSWGIGGVVSSMQVPADYTPNISDWKNLSTTEIRSQYFSCPTCGSRYWDALFGLGYMQPIPPTAKTGYTFWKIDNPGQGICNSNCRDMTNNNIIACMCQTEEELAKGSGCYYGASMWRDGHIERFKTDSCKE